MKNIVAISSLGSVVLVSALSSLTVTEILGPSNIQETLQNLGLRPLSVDGNSDDSLWKEKVKQNPELNVLADSPEELFESNIKQAKETCKELMSMSKWDSEWSSGFPKARNHCSVPLNKG